MKDTLEYLADVLVRCTQQDIKILNTILHTHPDNAKKVALSFGDPVPINPTHPPQ